MHKLLVSLPHTPSLIPAAIATCGSNLTRVLAGFLGQKEYRGSPGLR
jgi:hypothetical protein